MMFTCINCGNESPDLQRKYGTLVKATSCARCNHPVDKYIEFEEFIILIDALLLSEKAFYHMIHNCNFKWKITLVLLLLESFALCRQKGIVELNESSFYICSLLNIADYLCTTVFLMLITIILGSYRIVQADFTTYLITLFKAVAIANLSKMFLLPILVWRNNTTDFGRKLHHLLVGLHYICSLVMSYNVTCVNFKKHRSLLSSVLILVVYIVTLKLKQFLTSQMELYFF